jgi:hypothetical protein
MFISLIHMKRKALVGEDLVDLFVGVKNKIRKEQIFVVGALLRLLVCAGFLFLELRCRSAVGPAQPVHSVSIVFLWDQSGRSMKLTTHLRLIPRCTCTSSLPYAIMAWCLDTGTYLWFLNNFRRKYGAEFSLGHLQSTRYP